MAKKSNANGTVEKASPKTPAPKLLSFEPVDFSLTAGTDIPPPPPSPPPVALASQKETEALERQTKPPSSELNNNGTSHETTTPGSPLASVAEVPSTNGVEEAQTDGAGGLRPQNRRNSLSSGRRLSKFLSLKSLNTVYDNPTSPGATSTAPRASTPDLRGNSLASPTSVNGHRPTYLAAPDPSRRPTTPSVADSNMTASKKVRSWFRRKRRMSEIPPSVNGAAELPVDVEEQQQRPKGPPPPTLPELGSTLNGQRSHNPPSRNGELKQNGLSTFGDTDMFRDIK